MPPPVLVPSSSSLVKQEKIMVATSGACMKIKRDHGIKYLVQNMHVESINWKSES